jgi:hypothetical protein
MRLTVIVGNHRADYLKRRSIDRANRRAQQEALRQHLDMVSGMAQAARDAGDMAAYENFMLHISEHQMKLNESD